jgi:hypothetical protein
MVLCSDLRYGNIKRNSRGDPRAPPQSLWSTKLGFRCELLETDIKASSIVRCWFQTIRFRGEKCARRVNPSVPNVMPNPLQRQRSGPRKSDWHPGWAAWRAQFGSWGTLPVRQAAFAIGKHGANSPSHPLDHHRLHHRILHRLVLAVAGGGHEFFSHVVAFHDFTKNCVLAGEPLRGCHGDEKLRAIGVGS